MEMVVRSREDVEGRGGRSKARGDEWVAGRRGCRAGRRGWMKFRYRLERAMRDREVRGGGGGRREVEREMGGGEGHA